MRNITTQAMNKARKDSKGFTLVELLVVIAILGILSAVVVFSVGGITDRGAESACEASSKALATASQSFFAENSAWAGDLAALEAGGFVEELPGTVDNAAGTVTVDAGVITYDSGTGNVTDTCA